MDFESALMPEILEFLKVAEQQRSSRCCDLEKYELWKSIVPIDESLRNRIEINSVQPEIVVVDDLTDNREDCEIGTNDPISHINTNDLVLAIKENLESQEILTEDLVKGLQTSLELEVVFSELNSILNGKDVHNFGDYLMNYPLINQKIIKLYCRHILIPSLFKEHSDNLQRLFSELLTRNTDLKLELLQEIKKTHSRTFLLYINHLSNKHKAAILRSFVFDVEKLERNHLELLDSLLNNSTEFEILRKIIELLSNQSDEFKCEKIVGKLLMNIIEFSQQNLLQLEQPLKHLIDTHQSVWKAKLRRKFDCCFEASVILSQSFL